MALGLKWGYRCDPQSSGQPSVGSFRFRCRAGIVPVPVHASRAAGKSSSLSRNDAAVKYCIAANRELLDKVKSLQPETPALKGIFTLQPLPDAPGWNDLLVEPTAKHRGSLQALRAAIHEDDLATIILHFRDDRRAKGRHAFP